MSNLTPLLAAKADLKLLSFPLLASPKIDGIRALAVDGVLYSRSGKPIPNPHVQELFSGLHGFDGELVVGSPCAPDVFRASQAVMGKKGCPAARYLVFDRWLEPAQPYSYRFGPAFAGVLSLSRPGLLEPVPQTPVRSLAELEAFEASCLAAGYEGVMLRRAAAPYKRGRSTAREAALLKLKRFAHAEAVITGLEEQRDAAGRPCGALGAFQVRDLASGISFALGAGFSAAERESFWRAGRTMLGALARYRHFPSAATDKPRFPVFAGLRSPLDMGGSHA